MTELSGKTAFVTGASRGIGAAIALKLAESGADIALTYTASPDKAQAVAQQIGKLGRRALALQADAADPAALKAAIDRTAAEFGRIDILVNNAGIAEYGAPQDHDLAAIDRMLAINTRAPFLAVQAVLPHMPDGGRIVSIGSCLGENVRFPSITLYSMSKAALNGMTRGLARDLGPRGITVNVVQPGPIDTDMNPADGESAAAMTALTALGRYGKPDEIAATVAFLASPGGGYITGAQIAVDGGTNA
ncbi:SDR family NAD(P)-dependent oxidoreductase [Ferrovibrio sp.]|uniref:SDR family NAD(P)-dependent oxidoreductase n=1 Tax=Ferrovibrio sp. TaxID=1917215 RepID=UPI0026036D42|nr:glucose 1-dehydrogenase [Ferrovibrio sp.]